MARGNKGEWSEFYTFLKVLVDRRLISADADLLPISGQDIPVLKIFRNETGSGDTTYDLSGVSDILIATPGQQTQSAVDATTVSSKLATIFSRIVSGGLGGFNIPEGDALMSELQCTHLRGAPAGSKEDISMLVHDPRTGQTPHMAYSIKSQVGSPSSLLNASGATNFVYEAIVPEGTNSDVQILNQQSTAKTRVSEFILRGGSLRFVGTQNPVFKNNMELIDTVFPELMGTLLLQQYLKDTAKLTDTIATFSDIIHLQLSNIDLNKEAAIYKLKHFLAAVALGLKPSHAWNGTISATGGYLILKANGDLVCYHIFNMDSFKEYLFKSTRFERASESRHGYGVFYQDRGRLFIKLNLQVRFTR